MAARSKNRLTAASRLASRHEIVEWEERRDAISALLTQPMITPEGSHAEAFRLIRLHSDWLRKWLQRWPGWTLVVAADVARLRKHPSPRNDSTRGLQDRSNAQERTLFTRRRYALLCLVLSALENEQRQTTIKQVASKTEISVRLDNRLQELGFDFDTKLLAHRRELVAVMRFLQNQDVLVLIDRDDLGYVQSQSDCLYRIHRSSLSTMLCSIRGASTVNPRDVDDLVGQLIEADIPETPQAQNEELQHRLVRRLLDDPVMYFDELSAREYEYFNLQGERILKELKKVTGLEVERRAEGVALLDPTGQWTDLGLPESGTRGHATLLLAEWFGTKLRECPQIQCTVSRVEVLAYVEQLARQHKSRWRKNADTDEGIRRILRDSIDILQSLSLIDVKGKTIIPRPAVARYRVGQFKSDVAERTLPW